MVAADAAAATDELLGVLRSTLGVVVPLALALVALGAWLLSAVSMRPVSRLREAMKSVNRKDLNRRLEGRGEDREFQELIGAYNAMLERLQASFEQASRFSADAAHELRTPLTILQGRLEQAIHKSDKRAIQSDLTEMLDELGRLSSVTRKLLLLSQADAGHLALHRRPVDLADMLDALVTDARMLVTDQAVTSAIEPGLTVNGDELLLRQLLNNLVSNAVRYGRPGGWINIAGRRLPSAIEVTVANAAVPIPAESRARLFDRFYRLDPARNRQSEGTGLGLSLAREIARAHGGELALEPSAADVVCVRLQLPYE
jgi:heavy metal sensor kinase